LKKSRWVNARRDAKPKAAVPSVLSPGKPTSHYALPGDPFMGVGTPYAKLQMAPSELTREGRTSLAGKTRRQYVGTKSAA